MLTPCKNTSDCPFNHKRGENKEMKTREEERENERKERGMERRVRKGRRRRADSERNSVHLLLFLQIDYRIY